MSEKPPKPSKPLDRPASPRFKKRGASASPGERTLREMTRMGPESIEEITKAFAEIDEHPPRAAALVAAAYTENHLRHAISTISTKFVLLEHEFFQSLCDPPGPMSSFYAMIDLGFALGLYGPVVRKDLHTIRRIRNGFAHTMRPITFDTPEVIRETKMLEYVDWLKRQKARPITEHRTPTMHDLIMNGFGKWPATEREKYATTCRLLAETLVQFRTDYSVSHRTPPFP